MKVDGKTYRTIWAGNSGPEVHIIDQTALPYELVVRTLRTMEEVAEAISVMRVRGAPLIGAAAAYGVALMMRRDATDRGLEEAVAVLRATRPTAVNLAWALERMTSTLSRCAVATRFTNAWEEAAKICDEDVAINEQIGRHGLEILRARYQEKQRPLNVLTHCNAGWLATVDWGTALAPIYMAHDAGIPVHVWVDETRPRNQGASLTAWELLHHGVPHTVVVDNAGGHLMQHGLVDLCIVGTDRTTRTGDVCNKIGTYLKALAAHDTNVPFYVAVPSPSIDWNLRDGVREIPIEERDADEVHLVRARGHEVRLTPDGSPARNYAFDVTPARYITALISERGVCAANEGALRALFDT